MRSSRGANHEVSLLEVQARWACSEIIGSNFSRFYDGSSDIASLRAKRSSGFPFDGLTADERYSLAFQCAVFRRGFGALSGRDQVF
jgi:hypothetical protein